MDIERTLKDRGAMYGDFSGHAKIAQNLKFFMRKAPAWNELTDDKKEALEMVAHKVARILNGKSDFIDGWRDCVGYLQLVINNLQKTPGATDSTTTVFTIGTTNPTPKKEH